MLKQIVALDRDGLDTRIVVITVNVDEGVDVEKAIKAACTEYCKTEEGRKTYEGNCNCFNWGDFDTYVPNDICRKHGFSKAGLEIQAEEVDFNEQLVDEYDIIGDE